MDKRKLRVKLQLPLFPYKEIADMTRHPVISAISYLRSDPSSAAMACISLGVIVSLFMTISYI